MSECVKRNCWHFQTLNNLVSRLSDWIFKGHFSRFFPKEKARDAKQVILSLGTLAKGLSCLLKSDYKRAVKMFRKLGSTVRLG